jgi:hypothetical protein
MNTSNQEIKNYQDDEGGDDDAVNFPCHYSFP